MSDVTTEELERLVREASGPFGDSVAALKGGNANNKLAVMAPALAGEVLAGRKWETQVREALREGCQGHSPTESPKCLYCQALDAMPAERSE